MAFDVPEVEQEEVAQDTEQRIRWEQVLAAIWGERKRILLISLLTALVALGISFLFPAYYKSSAVLLPETDKNKLSSLGQMAGLASLAGVNVPGGTDISRLYPSILTSETVLRGVIEKEYTTERFDKPANLTAYFDLDEPTPEENFDKALKTLRDLMTTSLESKTNVVTVTVEMREPKLAADVLNAVVAETDKFMRQKKTTNASEQRKWIEQRLTQVEVELRGAEDALKNFRERNRRVGDSPQLLLEQERFLREVQVKSTMFIELTKQAELAKIEEIKNITLVNVLDEARAPVKKERPKRGLMTLIVFLAAVVGSAAYIAGESRYAADLKRFVALMKSHPRSVAAREHPGM
jgi:uncharacterized protein involved in exopolysaccharide biosynthesis